MLASFLATNYAVYTSSKTPHSFFPEIVCRSNAPVFMPNFQRRAMDGESIKEMPKMNENPDRVDRIKNTTMKFSIQNILGENQLEESKELKENEEDEDASGSGDVQSDSAMALPWLQCTRYKPPKLQRIKKEGIRKRKLGRNPRVPFSQHQVAALEQKFRGTRYLSSMDVAELSASLNLAETRVKIWFQNRRARERRDRVVERDNLLHHKPFQQLPNPGVGWSYPRVSESMLQFRQPFLLGGSAFSPVAFQKFGGQ